MYDKCYFCLDQLLKLKKESTPSFFVNFGRSRGTKEPTYITVPYWSYIVQRWIRSRTFKDEINPNYETAGGNEETNDNENWDARGNVRRETWEETYDRMYSLWLNIIYLACWRNKACFVFACNWLIKPAFWILNCISFKLSCHVWKPIRLASCIICHLPIISQCATSCVGAL